MEDVKVIEGKIAVDDRGTVKFINDFNFKGVKRFYQVENHNRNMVRAWHCHNYEGKYVYVVKGAVLIGTIKDFENKNSVPQKFILCEELPKILWIPPKHGNGFMTLRNDTIIQFFSTATLEESMDDDIRLPFDKWWIWDIENR